MTAVRSISDIESTSGVPYSGAGNGGLYSAIAPGQYTLTARIADTTGGFKDRPIDTFSATIADGKSYSVYLSGLYDSTAKHVDAFVVEDPVPEQFDYSVAYVRFVNAIYNANPLTLYAKNTDATVTTDSVVVGGAVAYKAPGAFTAVPNGVYNLIARYTRSNRSGITPGSRAVVPRHMYTHGAPGATTPASGHPAPAPGHPA